MFAKYKSNTSRIELMIDAELLELVKILSNLVPRACDPLVEEREALGHRIMISNRRAT